MIVREALVADPRVLPAAAGVREAAELLTHPNVRTVLVVDGDRLVGCATQDTIVRALADGLDPSSAAAADVASAQVTTVAPDAPIEVALRLMAEHDLERLAVVEDGRFLGIVPREPLVRRLAEDEPPPDPAPLDQQQV